jgi:hypothetical protein
VDDNLTSFSSLVSLSSVASPITLSSFFFFSTLGALVSLESLLAFSPLGAFSALLALVCSLMSAISLFLRAFS